MNSVSRCPTCGRTKKRSTEANRRYWAILHVMADKLNPQGKHYSADTWHEYCKSRWLGCKDIDLPNGKTMTITNSTADLDTGAFALYQEAVEAWANEHGAWLDE